MEFLISTFLFLLFGIRKIHLNRRVYTPILGAKSLLYKMGVVNTNYIVAIFQLELKTTQSPLC